MNASWLTLPLSARGLLRELVEVVGDAGVLETSLANGADAKAAGDEVARLLGAFRNEYVRVRRDVEILLGRGILALDGSRVRVVDHVVADADVEATPRVGGSAKRMRDLRARRRAAANESPSHVALGDVTGDGSSDVGDASPSLSSKIKKINSTEERARERHRDANGDARNGRPHRDRVTRDMPFDDGARAIAEKVALRDGDAVWLKFIAYWADRTLPCDWENLWQKWVADEVIHERKRPLSKANGNQHPADLDAPWIRAAMGGSS